MPKPKVPRARSIISNRKNLKIARDAMAALPPEKRDELRFAGLGPGEAYIVMWRVLNTYRRRAAILQGLPDLSDEQQLRVDDLLERIIACCTSLMPYEKARLTAVKVSGDSGNPMFAKVDLSHLPDEDIHALARILPKLGGGTANGAQGDAAGHARGDAAPNRAEGARSDREELSQLATPADRPRAWQHTRREPS